MKELSDRTAGLLDLALTVLISAVVLVTTDTWLALPALFGCFILGSVAAFILAQGMLKVADFVSERDLDRIPLWVLVTLLAGVPIAAWTIGGFALWFFVVLPRI